MNETDSNEKINDSDSDDSQSQDNFDYDSFIGFDLKF